MRGALLFAATLAVTLALGGCGDLFDAEAPEGYACSSSGTCPPGQQCVPGEHVCRTPCTQTSMLNGGGRSMNNGQCHNITNGGQSSNGGWFCDYDHFCRPGCSGNSGNICGGCSGTDVCDVTVGICRPSCTGGCPSTWGCVDLSNGNNSVTSICAGCRPLSTSTFTAPVFAPPTFYESATAPSYSVAAGDLHGNGRASVVTTDRPSGKIYVWANDGAGALQAAAGYATMATPFDTVVVDIDRDGKNDVVVATVNGTAGGPVFFPGHGDGTLGALVGGPTMPSTKLALGDFDGDGKGDVAVCGGGTNQLDVVTADGAGGLKTLSTFGGNNGASFQRLGTADLNGDGKSDVWADDEHGFVNAYLGNGMGGFSQGPGSSFGTRLDEAVLDVDGDGKLDMVVVTSMPATSGMGYFITVGHGNGSGGFNINGSPLSMPNGGNLAAADFDGDGKVDVALVETPTMKGTSNVQILSNDGTHLLWSETIAISKGSAGTITTGDVDGDGKPDIVLGLIAGGVAVLLNHTPATH